MSHSITAKLNKPAREFANQSGVTFFVTLGEKNYDYKTQQSVWTNYDAALFAKDNQIDFYRSSLIEGAIIEVSGTGIVVDDTDKQYKPKLIIQDAKLGFINSPAGQQQAQQAPAQQYAVQQPPAQQYDFSKPQQPPQAPVQQGGFQQAPAHQDNFQQTSYGNNQAPTQQCGFQQQPNNDEPAF